MREFVEAWAIASAIYCTIVGVGLGVVAPWLARRAARLASPSPTGAP